MAARRPDPLKDLYRRWSQTFAERGELPLDEWRDLVEEWSQATAEPGGVDYSEVDAGGVPAMWQGSSWSKNASKDVLLNREFSQRLTGMLLGEFGDPGDPQVSPLYADLAGLPPLYIQASTDEGIVDDGRRFAERAKEAGVDVGIDLFDAQQHTFQIGAGRSPEADEAIRRLADWARPRLGL